MALSMDEQRVLAEIERRLAAEDPGLATRLSSFRRPGPLAVLRSPRVRIVGSVFTVAMVAMVSLVVYAMIPLRAHTPNSVTSTSPQASPAGAVLTVPDTHVTSATSHAAKGSAAKASAPRSPAGGASANGTRNGQP